jgi:ParB family chromosome partitioning protein
MARGIRTNLADLAAAVGDNSPVENFSGPWRSVRTDELAHNPRNPRDDLGDLSDLASIVEMQLQPAAVVTQAAYLSLYPGDNLDPSSARFVVINGNRRLAAAREYGREHLDVVVNDAIARDRVTLIAAAIEENVARQDFDVIEEAKAVEALVAECGTGDKAAVHLHKTPGWISQRRALLHLEPELQAALRRGELAIREARSLARVPREEQVARWAASLDRAKKPPSAPPKPNAGRAIGSALGVFEKEPDQLAEALQTYLGVDGLKTLLPLLKTRIGSR